MNAVITITMNPAVDKSSSVERIVPNDKLRCSQPSYDPGGGGLNVSRVLSKLDCSSLAIYTNGGPTGKLLNKLLQEEKNIELMPTELEAWTRENLLVIESSTSNQYRFGMPGPDIKTTEWQAVISNLEKSIKDARYLVASGSLPPGVPIDFYRQLSEIASTHGVRFILDTSGQALSEGLKHHCYLIKPNLRELRQLTGRTLMHEAEQEEAAEALVHEGKVEVVVLSLGSAGALLVTKDIKQRLRSPTVPIVSKVGAGDSMLGGIVFGLLHNMNMINSVQYGIACSASTVSSPGTQLCNKDEVERIFQRIVAG
ncbi:MAG: 1-phosphofructokinase family hexose kinase [Oligoflexus sp.]